MPESSDVREQLAAYLAGELDAAEAAAIEARMASEPWVAEAADDMADMLSRLGRVDEVDPPAGFSARLRDALAEEIGHELPAVGGVDAALVRTSGAAAADGWSTGPRSRDDARRPGSGRPRRQRMNRAVMGVAAAVAVLFVGSTAVFLGGGLTSSNDTADSAVESTTRELGLTEFAEDETADAAAEEAPAAEALPDAAGMAAADEADLAVEGEPEALSAPADEPADAPAADTSDDTSDGAADDAVAAQAPPAQADESSPTSGAAGPEILALGELADDERIRVEVGQREAVERLLGRSASDAQDLAAPYRDEILRAEPFTDGTPPGACVETVLQDAEDVVVPAVAAQFTLDGEARLGYAVVRASDGGTLDTVDVWVVDPDGCAVTAVLS